METRSRKRHRSESECTELVEDLTGDTIEVESDNAEPIVHDEDYYQEDGDCVILVGRILFKIHRFLLKRDASAFSNMFSMPQDDADVNQANTEENPLVLYDDVDEFRALCWIIYALPDVYMQQYKIATANMQNLVSLYLIAQKYHFETHEMFARDMLQRHCSTLEAKPTIKPNYFFTCPESQLKSLLRISTLTERSSSSSSFPSLLQKIWMLRLRQTKESISFALGVGEALGLRGFVADLYYLELTRMKAFPLKRSGLAYAHPTNNLEPHQKLALYQGSWSLRYYWEKVHEERPLMELECSSKSHHDCQGIWKRSWKYTNFPVAPAPFDPLQNLVDVQDLIRELGQEGDFNVSCAVEAMDAMMVELKESFADHFLGPSE